MNDNEIIALYWQRSQDAIAQTASKYGKYCRYIAHNILSNDADAEECVNDTYLRAWNALPPHRPEQLIAFLGKITRNLALNLYYKQTAAKRGGSQAPIVLDELEECLPASGGDILESMTITDTINAFLENLPVQTRKIFMRRYWYLSSIKEIATQYNLGESNVKMLLLRARTELKQLLEKEGIAL